MIGIIFLALLVLFLASTILLYRSIKRRRYIRAALFAIPFAVLAFYFADLAVGPFQGNPRKTFQYALGFVPPAGCTELYAYKQEGFFPGVTIWLRFRVSPDELAKIISQGHFLSRRAWDFSEPQKSQTDLDWWTPPLTGNFWQSSDFKGPYSMHDASLAYDTNSQIAFIYVKGLD